MKFDIYLELYDDTEYTEYIHDKDIIGEPSFNIMDLIEEGDYVNGYEVIDKRIDNLGEEYLECGVGDYIVCTYYVNEIENIVTKEQFKSMEYKIGDSNE